MCFSYFFFFQIYANLFLRFIRKFLYRTNYFNYFKNCYNSENINFFYLCLLGPLFFQRILFFILKIMNFTFYESCIIKHIRLFVINAPKDLSHIIRSLFYITKISIKFIKYLRE